MVDPDNGPPPESRPPRLSDLVSLCRSLNRERARYVETLLAGRGGA